MRVAESNRPQVLNASTSASSTSSEPPPDGDLSSSSHRDERQIMLDTDRSFVHYPSGEAPSFILTPVLRSELGGMLTPNHLICRRE